MANLKDKDWGAGPRNCWIVHEHGATHYDENGEIDHQASDLRITGDDLEDEAIRRLKDGDGNG